MSFLPSRSPLLVLTACSSAAIGLAAYGCSSTSGGGTSDAGLAAVETGSDAEPAVPDAAALDASCPKAKALPDKGETCVGFGKGSPW